MYTMFACLIFRIIVFLTLLPVVVSIHQVKKEEKQIKRSVIKSVVGTLDLNIRFFLQGETFPGV